jgi:hypothetical protein
VKVDFLKSTILIGDSFSNSLLQDAEFDCSILFEISAFSLLFLVIFVKDSKKKLNYINEIHKVNIKIM